MHERTARSVGGAPSDGGTGSSRDGFEPQWQPLEPDAAADERPDAETPVELELLVGPIGASLSLKPLGDADLGSVGAVPPSATPIDAPPVDDLPTSVWGIASDRVASVELRIDDGTIVDGELCAIPPGPSTRAVVLVLRAGRGTDCRDPRRVRLAG